MSVGTSLLAQGVWAAGTFVAGALAGGTAYGQHNPTAPTNPLMNPYRSSDGRWFMLVVTAPHWPRLAEAICHPELLEDPRFADPKSMAANSPALTGLLDATFRSQPLAHWRDVLDRARITYGVIQSPEEAARDPQLRPNDIVVPLQGDDGQVEIISSPITVRGFPKEPATRAPDLGEHNEQILGELGFSDSEIEQLGRSEAA
jgi:formyl-CoA transferase